MRRQIFEVAMRSVSSCAKTWAAIRESWKLTGSTRRYRPEAHYMRGPGPKWRAKYGQIKFARHIEQ